MIQNLFPALYNKRSKSGKLLKNILIHFTYDKIFINIFYSLDIEMICPVFGSNFIFILFITHDNMTPNWLILTCLLASTSLSNKISTVVFRGILYNNLLLKLEVFMASSVK